MSSLQNARIAFAHANPTIQELARAIVAREGGFENNPADAGGATQYGISLLFARSETYLDAQGHKRLTFDFNNEGCVEVTDIREITPEIAEAIFVADFFVRPGLNCLPECLQPCVFDTSVNGGPAHAVRLVQMTLNTIRQSNLTLMQLIEPVKVDGKLGGQTNLAAHLLVDHVGADVLVNTYVSHRVEDYQAIARANPQDQAFLAGWISRAESFRDVEAPAPEPEPEHDLANDHQHAAFENEGGAVQ